MAEGGLFPPPPALYELYTAQAVADGTAPAPPPIPAGTYTVFGCPFNPADPLLQDLEKQGLTRLYDPTKDKREEIKRLTQLLLEEFLALLDSLSKSEQDQRDARMERMQLLFFNVHHLINEFRPHQGKEILRAMLQAQVREREDIIQELLRQYDQVTALLRECVKK